MKTLSILIFSVIVLTACGSKPKVISAEESGNAVPTAHGMMNESPHGSSSAEAHSVVCRDFMHTDKYTYMDVEENGERFWIAVPRQDVEKGAEYHYTGGLMKKNFKSIEYDRIFETIYLVSSIAPHSGGSAVDKALAHSNNDASPHGHTMDLSQPVGDVVTIKELFDNRAKYDGKVVAVSGKCVKVNKMIMGRNWIHIDDGTMEGDLTVTTQDDVAVGASVTMSGTIALNRDFGAGYKYEVIMEEAKVVQ